MDLKMLFWFDGKMLNPFIGWKSAIFFVVPPLPAEIVKSCLGDIPKNMLLLFHYETWLHGKDFLIESLNKF